MSELLALHVLSTVLLGVIFGGMLFFAAFMAPMVFIKLRAEVAGAFIRQVFPIYYGTFMVLCAASTWLLSQHRLPQDAFLMGAVAVGFAFAGIGLMPRLNTLRDRQLKGDKTAESQFKWLHRLSVALNTLQLILVLAIFLRAIAG